MKSRRLGEREVPLLEEWVVDRLWLEAEAGKATPSFFGGGKFCISSTPQLRGSKVNKWRTAGFM